MLVGDWVSEKRVVSAGGLVMVGEGVEAVVGGNVTSGD